MTDHSIANHIITFRDRGNITDEAPVHVTSVIEIDGKPIQGCRDGFIMAGRNQGTVVALEVDAEHVAMPFLTSDGEHVYGGIGGHAFLCPPLEDMPWELTNPDADPAEEVLTVGCFVYAARVVLR